MFAIDTNILVYAHNKNSEFNQKDNNISGHYTVNVDDFKNFEFLTVINPLAKKPGEEAPDQ